MDRSHPSGSDCCQRCCPQKLFVLLIRLPDGSSNPAITKLTSLSLLKPVTLVTASHFIPVVSPDCELTVIIDWPLIVNDRRRLYPLTRFKTEAVIVSSNRQCQLIAWAVDVAVE